MVPGFAEIEQRWQREWYSRSINEAERDDREKFMLIFAYPGVTGYLHVGHMRGYTYVDAIGRFKRMQGYNVLFPVGTHATGNGAISLAKRISERDPSTVDYMVRNGCPEERLDQLGDARSVVDFFNEVYVNDYWKRFGFLADWRRFTCTIYPEYQRFIQWQFIKLREAGLLVQRPYYAPACVNCGPVAVDASETDISKGGNAETTEYTLLKFRCGDEMLVAATLRPETMYGQTNFWANPEVDYVRIRRGEETWVVSRPAYEKLTYQMDDVEMVDEVPGMDLMGRMCVAPIIGREVPVLPATFCDPDVGTGLVTSVPSDAPDDWVALKMLKSDHASLESYGIDPSVVDAIEPVAIIETRGYGPLPGVELVEEAGIERSGHPMLEELKKKLYKDSFHTGRMTDACGPFAGLRVDEAKDRMRDSLIESGDAELFYDLSEEVVCRCGNPVVIRKVPDQWFIDYANADLTARTKAHTEGMLINPGDYRNNIKGVLDWFRERACVRQGNWLGTTFPFDDRWIIEAISDSTLYPAYYTISHHVSLGALSEENLTPAFFDHVFLGKGDEAEVSQGCGVDLVTLRAVRRDVEYWYPLDMNLGGKEHMTVHFPAFLFNHVGILPEAMWPRSIFVNWYITGKKGKISKSKGGAQPIPGAAERYGVDPMRLYYAHVASPFADVEWDDETVFKYRQRMERIMRIVSDVEGEDGPSGDMEAWLMSRLSHRISNVNDAMGFFDLRTMATEVYFEMLNDLRWYQRRGGDHRPTILSYVDAWVRMMSPVTPHLAEEMWLSIDGGGLVSECSLPEPGSEDADIESSELYLRSVLDDLHEIVKVTGIKPSKVCIYTSPEWKMTVARKGLALLSEDALSIPTLTKASMSDPDIRSKGKGAADFARSMAEELSKAPSSSIEDLSREFDEAVFLNRASDFISTDLGAIVEICTADDAGRYDPVNKSRAARPRRPAIYIE